MIKEPVFNYTLHQRFWRMLGYLKTNKADGLLIWLRLKEDVPDNIGRLSEKDFLSISKSTNMCLACDYNEKMKDYFGDKGITCKYCPLNLDFLGNKELACLDPDFRVKFERDNDKQLFTTESCLCGLYEQWDWEQGFLEAYKSFYQYIERAWISENIYYHIDGSIRHRPIEEFKKKAKMWEGILKKKRRKITVICNTIANIKPRDIVRYR